MATALSPPEGTGYTVLGCPNRNDHRCAFQVLGSAGGPPENTQRGGFNPNHFFLIALTSPAVHTSREWKLISVTPGTRPASAQHT